MPVDTSERWLLGPVRLLDLASQSLLSPENGAKGDMQVFCRRWDRLLGPARLHSKLIVRPIKEPRHPVYFRETRLLDLTQPMRVVGLLPARPTFQLLPPPR